MTTNLSPSLLSFFRAYIWYTTESFSLGCQLKSFMTSQWKNCHCYTQHFHQIEIVLWICPSVLEVLTVTRRHSTRQDWDERGCICGDMTFFPHHNTTPLLNPPHYHYHRNSVFYHGTRIKVETPKGCRVCRQAIIPPQHPPSTHPAQHHGPSKWLPLLVQLLQVALEMMSYHSSCAPPELDMLSKEEVPNVLPGVDE